MKQLKNTNTKREHRKLCSLFVYFISIVFVFACESDALQESSQIKNSETIPDQISKNIQITYSDSGIVKMQIFAPISNRFLNENDSNYIEFTSGLEAKFFNKKKKVESNFVADYVIFYEKEEKWIARKNVIVYNFKEKRKLNTEFLVYDGKLNKIYSDSAVLITTPDQKISGIGFQSNTSFTKWKIINPVGFVNAKDNVF